MKCIFVSVWIALSTFVWHQEDRGRPVREDLRVRLVDSSGSALGAGWRVQLRRWVDGELEFVQEARFGRETGCATFSGLGDDELVVQAVHETGERTSASLARLGEDRDVELRFEGTSPKESLYVSLVWLPTPAPARIVALDEAGTAHELVARADSDTNFVARGIGDGRYRVEVHDPRFERLLLEDAATGVPHVAMLRGSAQLALRFIDAVDGSAVHATNGVMWVTSADGQRSLCKGPGGPWWRPAQLGGIPAQPPSPDERTPIGPDGRHRITGLMPGSAVRVLATFERYLEIELDAAPLAAGEERSVDVPVSRGLEVSGRITDRTGAPIEGAFVLPLGAGSTDADALRDEEQRLYGPHEPLFFPLTGQEAMTDAQQQLVLRDIRSRATRSGADGTFRVGGLALDTRHVLVSLTPWDLTRVDIENQEQATAPWPRATANLSVAQRGAVDVQLRLDGPRDFAAYPQAFEFALQIGDGPWRTESEASRSLLDNDWCMRLRGLPLERCRFRVIPRPVDGNSTEEEQGRTFEFVPAHGEPKSVEISLTPLRRR